MSFGIRRIAITTDGAGAFTTTVHLYGTLHAVNVELGNLSTPDITLTDDGRAVDVLAVSGLATSTFYQLAVQLQGDDGQDLVGAFGPPAITGSLKLTVAGGGATTSGTVTCLVSR